MESIRTWHIRKGSFASGEGNAGHPRVWLEYTMAERCAQLWGSTKESRGHLNGNWILVEIEQIDRKGSMFGCQLTPDDGIVGACFAAAVA